MVNHWMIVTTAVLVETLRVCEATGLDPRAFEEYLRGSPPLEMSYALGKLAEMREHDYPVGFPVRLAAKDLRLVSEVSRHAALNAPLLDATIERFTETMAAHADDDVAAVYEVVSAKR
ncbi:NAD-binding protein [Actinopolymorpha pittospori]